MTPPALSDVEFQKQNESKEKELENEINEAEKKKSEDKQIQLSVEERLQEADDKVLILESQKQGIDSETKQLLEMLADIEKRKAEILQSLQEAESRGNVVNNSYDEHRAEALRLSGEINEMNDKNTVEKTVLQNVAEKSAVDEVFVEPPQPEVSDMSAYDELDHKDIQNDGNIDDNSESVTIARLRSEDSVENSIVEDDLLNEEEKERFAEKRKEYSQVQQAKVAQRQSELQLENDQEAMLKEDDFSHRIEAGLKREQALKDLYQSLLNQTMIDVMAAINEKRALEAREQAFHEDCHLLIQNQLKSRYNRKVHGLVRAEQSKNQSYLSSEQTKEMWKSEEENTALLSRLMRSERNNRQEIQALKLKHETAISEMLAEKSKLHHDITVAEVKQNLVIEVLENNFKEKSELLKAAEETIMGEETRREVAVSAALAEQSQQQADYKHNLPAIECQTDDDQVLLTAYDDIETLKNEKNDLNDQINDFKYEIESLQTELLETKTEFKDATEYHAECVATVLDHRDKSKFLTLKLEAANVEIERINLERVKIADELSSRAANQQSLESQSNENNSQVESLQRDNEKLLENELVLKSKQRKSKSLINRLREQLKEKQAEIDKMTNTGSPRPQVDVEVDNEYDDFEYDDDEDGLGVSTADKAALSPDRQSKAEALTGVSVVRTLRNQRSTDDSGENSVEGTVDPSGQDDTNTRSPRSEPLLPQIGKSKAGMFCRYKYLTM